MVATPPRPSSDAIAEADSDPPAPYDPLDMLVTSEPVDELDDALACLGRQLRQARRRVDSEASARLQRWIDGRLDERNTLRTDPNPQGPDNQ